MPPRTIPGWPLWQRLNFLLLTLSGGYAGFALQNRYIISHKAELQTTLPQLENDLTQAIRRRQTLESQLRDLTSPNPHSAYRARS